MAAGFAAVWQHADERDMRGFGGDRVIDIVAQIDRRGWIAPVEDNLQAFWMGLRMLHVFHCHDGLEIWAQAIAVKRVISWQLAEAMRKKKKTKQALAKELNTSRSQLDRLLDPQNIAVSLDTITRAARALGKRLIIRIADAKAG